MTTERPFKVQDLFEFNNVNLDVLTETYYLGFYIDYMVKFPELFIVQESPDGKIMSYIIGKAEGKGERWHGHVSAVSVAPEYRRLGLATTLMNTLEEVSDEVIDYYSGPNSEDAYDMRKALKRDAEKKSMIPLPHPVYPGEFD